MTEGWKIRVTPKVLKKKKIGPAFWNWRKACVDVLCDENYEYKGLGLVVQSS